MTLRKAFALLAGTLVLLSCSAVFAPTATPTLSPTPAASITPEPLPSPTPSPTSIPLSLPSPLATFAYVPTLFPTLTAATPLDCRLVWQSPGNGVKYHPRDYFTVGWKVTNIGSATWTPGSVELTYVGGNKLYLSPSAPLKVSVSPGQSVILNAEMRAPRKLDIYTTYWSLRQGNTYFCRLAVTIYVEE